MKEAVPKVPLEVSTVGFEVADPLPSQECTQFLSRLDGEVRKPPCPFTFPQHEKRNPDFEIQPTIRERIM